MMPPLTSALPGEVRLKAVADGEVLNFGTSRANLDLPDGDGVGDDAMMYLLLFCL